MTIDEAIKWYEDKETEYKYLSKEHEDFSMMAEQYHQFIEWLMELKDLRAEQNDQYIFIHELMTELKEAKRLLKVAMEDMNTLYDAGKDEGCIGIKFKWRFADEALKLIGEDVNGI